MTKKPPKKRWQGMRWIRYPKRLAIYARDGFRCVYCLMDLTAVAPMMRTLDHVTPRSCNGSNHERNLVTACKPCNSARGDKKLKDFASDEAVKRIQRQRRRVLRFHGRDI